MMVNRLSPRMLNLGLRSLSMGGRFLLILSIAKLLAAEEVGMFGLLGTGIGFSVLLLGLDFYGYANRELLATPQDQYARILSYQIVAYFPLYLLFIPLILLFFIQGILPWQYAGWFLGLVMVEHISTELNRLLNMMQYPLSATVVLFLRSSLWIMVVIPLMMFDTSFRSLETLLTGWFIGGIVSILYGLFSVKKVIPHWQWHTPDMAWIRQGYRTGMLFFAGTISLQAISLLDKFWLEYLSSVKEVGVYVFYLTLVQGAIGFIHAGLIVFISPKIVKSFQEGRYTEFNQLLNRFGKELFVAAVLMGSLILFAMPFVVGWVGREVYLEHYDILYIMIISGMVMVVSNHPHTFLYAARKDRYMLFSNISALAVFLLLLWRMKTLSSLLPLYQVSLSFLGTHLWILSVKTAGYLYYRKQFE